MIMRRLAITTVVLALLATLVLVGCGPKPPCPVPPEEVRAAQDRTSDVKANLDEATAQREKLETELSDKEARLSQLKSDLPKMEKEAESLKKGSGR
jgi:predicted small lipoprotein YifL